jgi:DNA polymerase-3 subunit delta'
VSAAEIEHTGVGQESEALLAATEHQPRARVALTAALAGEPTHAYLFRGPRGSGKRAAARAFAAEILAAAAADPEDARRRALLDPSPHPDLVWLTPAGAQHMVEEVRERVIRAAAYRPFEGGKRVFVVEAAEAMRDESQNALLKTLEEPPGFVHLIRARRRDENVPIRTGIVPSAGGGGRCGPARGGRPGAGAAAAGRSGARAAGRGRALRRRRRRRRVRRRPLEGAARGRETGR